MSERKVPRREFIRFGLIGAGSLAAGAVALGLFRRTPDLAADDASPGPVRGTNEPLLPWLGFVPAGALDGTLVSASAAQGALPGKALRLQVAGQMPDAVTALRGLAVEVMFGADASRPFHAWSASLSPIRSVSPGVGCQVPNLPRGLALRLTVSAEPGAGEPVVDEPVVHELVLGGPTGSVPLVAGQYFVALAPRAPRWSDFSARAQAGGAPRLQGVDGTAPEFACLALTVTPV